MNDLEKREMKSDEQQLLDALSRAGADVRNPKKIACLWHTDEHPSGGIAQKNGQWFFHCFSCGVTKDVFDVLALADGKPVSEVFKAASRDSKPTTPAPRAPLPKKSDPPKRVYPSIAAIQDMIPAIRHTYQYCHPETRAVEMVVFRLHETDGRKSFLQAHPEPGGFVLNAPEKPWPVYNRTRVRDSELIIVCEGEKCVHALTEAGFTATTSPGGAKNARSADWSPLAGKIVYLWPDFDEPGAKYIQEVREQLERLSPVPQLHLIDAAQFELPEGSDCVDYFASLPDQSKAAKHLAVEIVLSDAKSLSPDQEVRERLQAMIDGRYSAIPWPWHCITKGTRALQPGTITIIAGDPGDSKSFFVLQAAAFWHERGDKVALFELEEDRTYHMLRALAMRVGNSNLTDPDWVKDNPDIALDCFENNEPFITGFSQCVYEAPDIPVKLDELAKWVEDRCEEKYRIICIDPVTAAIIEGNQWVQDAQFMLRCKIALRAAGASLVIVTHPKSGKKSPGGIKLEDVAGGTAIQRFSQTVITVQKHYPSKQLTVYAGLYGVQELIECNRSIFIRKARNAGGSGGEIGFTFDGNTLRFVEHGPRRVEVETT